MRDMIMSTKHGDKVLIAQPVVADKAPVVKDKAPIVADKALIVANKHKADVVKLSNVVADKPINVVVADNADVDDSDKVVKENVLAVVNDKASDALKNKPADVKEKLNEKGKKSIVGKDTGLSDILKYKPKNNASK
nr:hypothetical protein [Tanacetum cinerariifolium]